MDRDRYQFEPIGITPPRGRLGHSVPTPRPLGSSLLGKTQGVANGATAVENGKLTSWRNTDLHAAATSGHLGKPSPAQFYLHREHALGGSLSKLDRVRPPHHEMAVMEPFDEEAEEEEGERESEGGDGEDSGRPVSRQSRLSSDLGQSSTSMSSSASRRLSATLDKFTGDSMLHYSYSAMGSMGLAAASDNVLGGSFVRAFSQGLNSSLNVPFVQQNSTSPSGGESSVLFPSAARNPNKAIVTIDALTSRILMANEMTCELFGYQKNELINMKVQSLFTEPYRAKQRALVEQNVDSSGKAVLISGKVMDAVTSYGVEFPVSVWMKRLGISSSTSTQAPPLPATPRVIVVIEPVERSSALFTMDHRGTLVSCDPWFACLFGFSEEHEMVGLSLLNFIPSLNLPRSMDELAKFPSKQAVTGRAKDGTVFPTTVKFTDVSQNLSIGDLYSPTHTTSSQDEAEAERVGVAVPTKALPSNQHDSVSMTTEEGGSPPGGVPSAGGSPRVAPDGDGFTINAKLIVYAALSGMISFLPDGTIHGCNHHFSLMLFGYTQQELLRKDITFLIPEFYTHINYVDDHSMPLPPLDEEDVFHPATERSLSPERMQDALRHTGRSDRHIPPSPAKLKALRSPAKRFLHPQLAPRSSDTALQDDTTPHHSSSDVKFDTQGSGLLSNEGSDTTCSNEGSAPSISHPSNGLTDPQGTQQHRDSRSSIESQERLSALAETEDIQDPLAWINSVGDGSERTLPPVPSRLVPSESTERIMDILKQRGLPVDTKGRSAKIDEESLSSSGAGHDESTDNRTNLLSSTPAATRGGDQKPHGGGASPLGAPDFDRESMISVSSLPEGTFFGDARHKDGSLMAIIFQLKCVTVAEGQSIFCMWISRDLDCERARTADLSMSMSRPPDPYRHDQIISPDVGLPSGDPHRPQEEVLAMEGEYNNSYITLTPIGKGAFGFVRLAQHKNDGNMVVVKFLRKSSVLKDCWVQDSEMGLVPREISLLARLSHPNIVQVKGIVVYGPASSIAVECHLAFIRFYGKEWAPVFSFMFNSHANVLLEAYENEFFFQMVMEKHGDGLDLFEFIEKNPCLNEQIISYMFRQVVSALSYLHERNILHRDIKDENIIIDRHFTLKLIDFGSAAYMEEGKLFHTFCGTLEYCSPEVLLGNSYSGPELEMWALGVTLYTLVFGENPFFDIEETISGHLQPPYLTSPGLMKVLFWLLHPDPRSRATLKDLQRDKWTNQPVDISQYNFEALLGYPPAVPSQPPSLLSQPPLRGRHNSDGDTQRLEHALEELLHVKEDDPAPL